MRQVRAVGILGGSFNPVHNGHVALAREILVRARLDEVWFMVSPQNPLKPGGVLADDVLRLEMTRLALEDEPRLVASDYEFRLPRPSYTWNTLRHLAADYPHHRFALIMGADNWQVFGEWRNGGDIIAAHRILIYPRRGCGIDPRSLPPGGHLIDTPLYDISSTMVRRALAEGRDVTQWLPPKVASFIARKGLYAALP